MPPEYVPPGVLATQLFIAYKKDHVIEYHVDGEYPKGEDIGGCVLPSSGPGLRASPQLVPTKTALQVHARWKDYRIL